MSTAVGALVGGRVLSPNGAMGNGTVTIDGKHISEVVVDGAIGRGARNGATIDVGGLTIVPGFVDLQVNGAFGLDLVADPECVWDLARALPRTGVTSFLPTIVSSPSAVTDAMIAALGAKPEGFVGADVVGAHFEGPMLCSDRVGAHRPEHLREAGFDVIEGWSATNGVAMVTLAPELTGAASIIEELCRRGVVVAAGHSSADAAQALASIDQGVSVATHLFNAMAPLGHRSPNLVGVALSDDRLTPTLVVDGIHVDPIVVKAIWNAKGPRGMVLVTDSVAAMGLGPGSYEFDGRSVSSDGEAVRNENGGLAGSALSMDRAVSNVMAFTGCTLAEAIEASSATPAAAVGRSDRGRIEPGRRADLTMLDQHGVVALTVCGGKLAFVGPGHDTRM